MTLCISITDGARAALSLSGTMLGFYPVRVLPSKTAIVPVNPTFLPRVYIMLSCFICRMHILYAYINVLLLQSEDELEMCARTVYCANIDKKVNF